MIKNIDPLMREIRTMVMPYFGNVESQQKTGEHDLVTELDVRVENFLREKLAELYPDVAFVGEETGGDRTAEKKWLCDPIDGTSYFIRGTPFCTTMLAYIENEVVMFSCIYDFVADKLYHATRNKGAFCEDIALKVSNRTMKQSFVAWELQIREENDLILHQKLAKKMLYTKIICAGYEFIMVITGKIEGRLTINPFGKDYDFAPGSLLVEEAGGIVANISKRTYDYNDLRFLATNKEVFQELTEGPEALFPITKN